VGLRSVGIAICSGRGSGGGGGGIESGKDWEELQRRERGDFGKNRARRRGDLQADRTVDLRIGLMRGRFRIGWRRHHAGGAGRQLSRSKAGESLDLMYVYVSILSPPRPDPLARPVPGPPTNLAGRAWAEVLKSANFFCPSPTRNAVFSCVTL
jgi:hypothetical protein